MTDRLGAIMANKLVLANIDKNKIEFSEFERIEQGGITGQGRGFVDKYFWEKEGETVILKTEPNWNPRDRSTFDREYKILASLKHKNIIQVFGFTLNTNIGRFSLVLELADGSLYDFLGDEFHSKTMSSTRCKWLQDLASAVNYLHNGAIVRTLHRDLKPQNVLVLMKDENINDSVLKLTDFGLSSVDTSNYESSRVVGTRGWGANESAWVLFQLVCCSML